MDSIRLMPMVVLSAVLLLLLKSVALMTNGGFVFTGTQFVAAQENGNNSESPTSDSAVKEPMRGEAGSDAALGDSSNQDTSYTGGGRQIIPGAAVRSEREVLGRLSERRIMLNKREEELNLRASLLKAAEKRVEGRVAELKTIEERINAAAAAKKKEQAEENMRLISMYESMKAKDAARIFNRLDIIILVDVARKIKPRKMADIMGKMSSEAAERLTVALARSQSDDVETQSVSAQFTRETPMARPLPKIKGIPVSKK